MLLEATHTVLTRLLLRGETTLVRLLRGVLGLGFVVLLLFYAMIHMIFQPIRETSLTPVREYRTTIAPDNYKIENALWNIVIGPVSTYCIHPPQYSNLVVILFR